MYEGGVSVTIGGREHRLVFTLAALLAVKEHFGGIQQMNLALTGPSINEEDSDEVKAEKQIAIEEAQENLLTEVPWLLATLANQGAMLANPREETITPEEVALKVMPYQLQALLEAAFKAINIGMSMEHQTDGGKRDPVLEELDAKNAEGAEAT